MAKIKKISGKQFKMLFYAIWFLIAIIILGAAWFLYYNFYQTIIDSSEIIILESDDVIEKINTQKINEVIDFHQKKIIPRENEIKLIFK